MPTSFRKHFLSTVFDLKILFEKIILIKHSPLKHRIHKYIDTELIQIMNILVCLKQTGDKNWISLQRKLMWIFTKILKEISCSTTISFMYHQYFQYKGVLSYSFKPFVWKMRTKILDSPWSLTTLFRSDSRNCHLWGLHPTLIFYSPVHLQHHLSNSI